jgi:hypothetical protein
MKYVSTHLKLPCSKSLACEYAEFTECKNLQSLIFADFSKIKRQKFAILDCAAILKDFQKRSSTKS